MRSIQFLLMSGAQSIQAALGVIYKGWLRKSTQLIKCAFRSHLVAKATASYADALQIAVVLQGSPQLACCLRTDGMARAYELLEHGVERQSVADQLHILQRAVHAASRQLLLQRPAGCSRHSCMRSAQQYRACHGSTSSLSRLKRRIVSDSRPGSLFLKRCAKSSTPLAAAWPQTMIAVRLAHLVQQCTFIS